MPTDRSRLSAFVRGVLSRMRTWHRRGWVSPTLVSHPYGSFQWFITLIVPVLIVVVPHLASAAVREWSLAHLSLAIPGTMAVVGILCYWWWARSDASAREALRRIALHGRISMPAGDLAPHDLLPHTERAEAVAAFLPRRLSSFENQKDSEFCVVGAIPSLLPGKNRHGRRVAFIGPAAMGKTRLVHELIRQLPSETIVFAPSRSLGGQSDASLRLSTRYLRGRSCVLVYDDLNFYVGRTDVAELEQVVAEQAFNHSTVVTCTTSALSQVRSEAEPSLNRFFSALDKYELLRMTEEQMAVLAADSAGKNRERDPKDCGGNPGLLLFDFQRLLGEFNSLSRQEVESVEAIHALFLAGIAPVTVDQVRALASSGFGAELGIPTVAEILDRLRLMSFIRESNPVVPEEAFIREVVPEDAVWTRMEEVEGILRRLGDARGLFQLGLTHHIHGDFEQSIRVMRLSAQLNRAAGGPLDLANAAQALYNAAISLKRCERPQQEVEATYREVVSLGLEAAIPEVQSVMAQALFNLGSHLFRWGREPQEIEAAWLGAALAGRGSETWGRVAGAHALFNLAMALDGWDRKPQEIEAAYREAAVAGREVALPEGLVCTAHALSKLGDELARWGRPVQEIECAYRDAAAAGREAGTPEGLVASALALSNLGVALARLERPSNEIETTYRKAAAEGFEAASAEGLAAAAQALLNLGIDLARWERPLEEVEATFREASAAGRESGTNDGLETVARACINVGNTLDRWEQRPRDVEAAYGEAVEAGREAATPEGLLWTAAAYYSLGDALMRWEREPEDVEAAWREAAAAARQSQSPKGLMAAARVFQRLGDALAHWGREPGEVEVVLREAVMLAGESETPDGSELVEVVSGKLRELRDTPFQ